MHKYTCLPSLLGTEISQEMSGENPTCGLSADHGLSSQRGISPNLHISESCRYLTTIISTAGSGGKGRPVRVRATAGLQSTSEWPRRGSPPAVNNMQPAGVVSNLPLYPAGAQEPTAGLQPEPLPGGPQSLGRVVLQVEGPHLDAHLPVPDTPAQEPEN